jgi:2-hydroxy-3-oxopropionate reductase
LSVAQRLPQIGFIGTGNIGQPIIHSMLRAGYSVAVWNRTPSRYADLVAAGATAAATPRELAARCDIVCAMLVEPAHLDALLDGPDGILAGIRAGSVFVDMATSPPRHAQWLEGVFAPKSVAALDAPVQGGVKAAADGTLTVMAGGDKAAYERVLPLLQAIGKTIVFVGPAGSGQLTKLAHQVICAVTLEGLAESFALAKMFGADQAAMHEVLLNGLASGPLLKTSAPAMFNPDFKAARPLWLYAKDRANLADTLRDTSLELPIAHAVFERMNGLLENGGDNLDEMSLYKLFELDPVG